MAMVIVSSIYNDVHLLFRYLNKYSTGKFSKTSKNKNRLRNLSALRITVFRKNTCKYGKSKDKGRCLTYFTLR